MAGGRLSLRYAPRMAARRVGRAAIAVTETLKENSDPQPEERGSGRQDIGCTGSGRGLCSA
jgi:hypothetical protein